LPGHGRFAATWEYGDVISWIEVRLSTQADGGTRFELEHISPVDDGGHWDQFGPGAVGIGWDMGLLGLTTHLESGLSAEKLKVQEWIASEDGRRFLSISSERWREADVAAGADLADAQARAARTTAAYTGAAPDQSVN
jgi:hypothetical protein